jgi:hypothetical protein
MLISLCPDDRFRITSVWKQKFEPKGCQFSDVCDCGRRVDARHTNRTAQTRGDSTRPIQRDVCSWPLRMCLFFPYKTQTRPRNAS